jgi:hypothetical protein
MVLALLAGRKTQTRRLYKPRYPPPYENVEDGIPFQVDEYGDAHRRLEPYGEPGDRLWVRETWAVDDSLDDVKPSDLAAGIDLEYLADVHRVKPQRSFDRGKTRPGIFMPRWASRLTLKVTNVRVERLRDITEEDARAEGVAHFEAPGIKYGSDAGCQHGRQTCARCVLCQLWESINGRASWDANPRVWVVGFKMLSPRPTTDGGTGK